MDPEYQLFTATLKKNGQFVTKPRKKLFELLRNHNSLPVAELIKCLDDQDQATVYRNIKVFEELGIISRLHLGWNSRLELSDQFHHHHHHLTCISCNRVVVLLENQRLEKLISSLAKGQRFLPVDHQLEIRGHCVSCQG